MKTLKYSIAFLLLAVFAMNSCSDSNDDLLAEIEQPVSPEEQDHGYSIGLTITLDAMGGRAATPDNDPLWDFENYIDPQKFRVLFFDKDNKFLFESKNRWMKQIETSNDNSRWYVSIPFFTYGNEDNWDWGKIKERMMSGDFKIAILANRPTMEWCPNYDDLGNDVVIRLGWFDNTGPHWGPADTDVKTVYDLHRCQDDPIYITKNYRIEKDKDTGKTINSEYIGFYEFIQGGENVKEHPQMGATASWVDYGEKDDITDLGFWSEDKLDDPNQKTYRYYKKPSKNYPIPMYGIQTFKKIDKWPEGTTLNLTRTEKDDKPISLLRSVVKLELLLPREPLYVLLRFTNVYSRCEPLNVWDPTETIWKDDHNKNETCEWFNIWKYGPISLTYQSGWSNDATYFQNRIAWFYKELMDTNQGWAYPEDVSAQSDLPAPKIFNACVQRNETVNCEQTRIPGYNDGYIHYVVYTGERNLNDPSALDKVNDYGTVAFWQFFIPDANGTNGKLYTVPMCESAKCNGYDAYPTTTLSRNHRPEDGAQKSILKTDYCRGVQSLNVTNSNYKTLPFPLLRNHVYRFKIGNPNWSLQNTAKTRSGEADDALQVKVEHAYTEDISFR